MALFRLVILIAYAVLSIGSSAYAVLSIGSSAYAAETNEVCLKNVKVWADSFSTLGQKRTLHFYRPKPDENDDIVVGYLYTPMEVYCQNGCKKTDEDNAVYTFYRITHYWTLNKVFKEVLACGNENMSIKKNILGKEKRLTLGVETDLSKINLAWDKKECFFEGASKVEWGGCISIKTSPIE